MNTSTEVVLTPELAAQVKLVARLQKRATKIQDDMAAAKAQLKLVRNHPDIEMCNSYCSGSYYDTAYTDYWNRCKICDTTSEYTRRSHGHYG